MMRDIDIFEVFLDRRSAPPFFVFFCFVVVGGDRRSAPPPFFCFFCFVVVSGDSRSAWTQDAMRQCTNILDDHWSNCRLGADRLSAPTTTKRKKTKIGVGADRLSPPTTTKQKKTKKGGADRLSPPTTTKPKQERGKPRVQPKPLKKSEKIGQKDSKRRSLWVRFHHQRRAKEKDGKRMSLSILLDQDSVLQNMQCWSFHDRREKFSHLLPYLELRLPYMVGWTDIAM